MRWILCRIQMSRKSELIYGDGSFGSGVRGERNIPVKTIKELVFGTHDTVEGNEHRTSNMCSNPAATTSSALLWRIIKSNTTRWGDWCGVRPECARVRQLNTAIVIPVLIFIVATEWVGLRLWNGMGKHGLTPKLRQCIMICRHPNKSRWSQWGKRGKTNDCLSV